MLFCRLLFPLLLSLALPHASSAKRVKCWQGDITAYMLASHPKTKNITNFDGADGEHVCDLSFSFPDKCETLEDAKKINITGNVTKNDTNDVLASGGQYSFVCQWHIKEMKIASINPKGFKDYILNYLETMFYVPPKVCAHDGDGTPGDPRWTCSLLLHNEYYEKMVNDSNCMVDGKLRDSLVGSEGRLKGCAYMEKRYNEFCEYHRQATGNLCGPLKEQTPPPTTILTTKQTTATIPASEVTKMQRGRAMIRKKKPVVSPCGPSSSS